MASEPKNPLSTEPYKGVRDFYPEDMFVLNFIFDVWRKTCESFGYVEYSASILEPSELYLAKSNEEIIKEQTYTFTDRGGREVTLRPEMTPTVARMIAAKRRGISFPIRWFSMPNLFRYERPQRGREREHFQLNADIFGIKNTEAEIEIITLAHAVMKNFGLLENQFVVKINDRGKVREALRRLGLKEEDIKRGSTLLDKRGKIETFDEEWKKLTGVDFDKSLFENPELQSFVRVLESRGLSNVEVDPSLVRGFEYYSGIVFEVFDTHKDNRRSLFGGGRYDNLVEMFGGESVPGVGFGMGDVTIRDTLETYRLLPRYQSSTDLYICLLDEKYVVYAEALAKELRLRGIRVAIDLSGRKVGEQIKKADKDQIPYVICIGDEEISSNRFVVKELKSGTETPVSRDEIPSRILRG